MKYTIYTFQVRSNIDNQPLTGSTIYPYYPPSAKQLTTYVDNSTYITIQDNETFSGYRTERARPSYKLPDGQIAIIKETYNQDYFIEVTIPSGLQNPVNPQQNGPYVFQTNETTVEPSLSDIIYYINTIESRVDYGSTWLKFTEADLQLIDPPPTIPSNGFRIRTEGFSEKIAYAEDPQSNVKLLPRNLDMATVSPTQVDLYDRILPDRNATYYIIDLGILTVDKLTADAAKETSTLIQVDDKGIIKNIPAGEKAKGLGKVAQIALQKTSILQSNLVKALTTQITEFGISQIKEVVEGKVDINKIPKICPTEAKILAIINLRNRLSQQLDTFYKTVTRLSNSLAGTTDFVTALNTGFTILSTTTTTANTVLGLLPAAPGQAVSAINILKQIEQLIAPNIGKISKAVGTLSSSIAKIVSVLTLLVNLLSLLDKLIQNCAEQLQMPYDLISNQFTALNNQIISNLQNTTSNITNSYKGFRFELLEDKKGNTKYPKKYAVAKDKYGVIQLKSESSFTPNPSVLISELKFIIDRDKLSAE